MAATEAYSGICDMKILGASASSLDELSSRILTDFSDSSRVPI